MSITKEHLSKYLLASLLFFQGCLGGHDKNKLLVVSNDNLEWKGDEQKQIIDFTRSQGNRIDWHPIIYIANDSFYVTAYTYPLIFLDGTSGGIQLSDMVGIGREDVRSSLLITSQDSVMISLEKKNDGSFALSIPGKELILSTDPQIEGEGPKILSNIKEAIKFTDKDMK